jgi:hypothetical protein
MNRHTRLVSGLAAILVLLLVGAPQPVRSDGGFFPPPEWTDIEMPAQKAIIVWDEDKGHEDLVLSVQLSGSPEAAWVVPVPSLPEVQAASPRWFKQLSALTQPNIETRVEYVTIVEVEKEVSEGIELLSREEVGVYDVSILSASEPGALLDWLNDNGYAFPEDGGPILDDYVEEGGWYFVAARVLPGESATLEGDVQPLWFSFDSARPVYPMRLTSLMEGHIEVLIYVLADHRMEEAKKFTTEFAGELTLKPMYSPEISDSEEESLVDLLTHRSYYVTKQRSQTWGRSIAPEDLYFERTTSDASYRKVIHHTRYVYRPATATPPSKSLADQLSERFPEDNVWLVLVGGLALLGLLAGVVLLWRRSRRKHDEA